MGGLDMAGFFKGQGATEYIVLLAIVLIIVLVVVGLLGYFPSFSSDTQVSESQAYWGSAKPLAIADASQTGGAALPDQNVTLAVVNHATQSIVLTSITLTAANGSTASNSTGWTLSPGERITPVVMGNSGANALMDCNNRGGKTNSYTVTFAYNGEAINGKQQVGTKPLIVPCGS